MGDSLPTFSLYFLMEVYLVSSLPSCFITLLLDLPWFSPFQPFVQVCVTPLVRKHNPRRAQTNHSANGFIMRLLPFFFLSPRDFKFYNLKEFRKKDAILVAASERQLTVHLFPTCPLPIPSTPCPPHTQYFGLLCDLQLGPKPNICFEI